MIPHQPSSRGLRQCRRPILHLLSQLLAGLALLAMLTACGSRSAGLRLAADQDLSRNEHGEATPVILRLFELRRDGRFRNAAFDTLWADPQAVLADDWVREPDEITIYPGDTGKEVKMQQLDKTSKFIGIMGLFRKASAGQQRTLIIPIDEVDRYIIRLSGYGLLLVDPKAATAADGS